MKFTQIELRKIKLALIRENIRLEWDSELGDYGPAKKKKVEDLIKSNENLIKEIEKEIK